jgi:hypothetical protein
MNIRLGRGSDRGGQTQPRAGGNVAFPAANDDDAGR